MRITNKYGLPATLIRALTGFEHKKPGEFSVTDTCNPTQLSILAQRHDNEIEIDIAEQLWVLLGLAMHKILDVSGDSSEVTLCQTIFPDWALAHGIRIPRSTSISGTIDLIDKDEICDWKVTSVWKYVRGEYDDWIKQLNFYACLGRLTGKLRAKRLVNRLILRDWSKREAGKGRDDYPQIPFVEVEQPFWTEKLQVESMLKSIAAMMDHRKTPDNLLPTCSEKERWRKPDTFAVYKNKNKTATRVCKDNAQAGAIMQQLLSAGHTARIEKREAEDVRCEDYCVAQSFCCQYKKKREGVNAITNAKV